MKKIFLYITYCLTLIINTHFSYAQTNNTNLKDVIVWKNDGKKFKIGEILSQKKHNIIFLGRMDNPIVGSFIFKDKYPFSNIMKVLNDLNYIYINFDGRSNTQNNAIYLNSDIILWEKLIDPLRQNPVNRILLIVDNNGDIISNSFGPLHNPLQILLNVIKPFSLKNNYPLISKNLSRTIKLPNNESESIDCILSFDRNSEPFGYGVIQIPKDFVIVEGGGALIGQKLYNLNGSTIKIAKKVKDDEKATEIITFSSSLEVNLNWKEEDLRKIKTPTVDNSLDFIKKYYGDALKYDKALIKEQGGIPEDDFDVEKIVVNNRFSVLITYRFRINGTYYERKVFNFGRINLINSVGFDYPVDKKEFWNTEIRKIMDSLFIIEMD